MKLRIAAAAGFLVLATPTAGAGPSCTCRAHGQDYEQGQIICIHGKLARCSMALNNSSWKIVSDICPESRRDQPKLFAGLPQLLQSSLPSR